MQIAFKNINGLEIIKDFFYKGKIAKEAVIESAFTHWLEVCTTNAIKILKLSCARGTTDGVIEFFVPGTNIHLGWGNQEVKRNITRNSAKYKAQFIQNLAYCIQLNNESPIDVVINNSESYYDYMILDENQAAFNEIKPIIQNALLSESPCNIHKIVSVDLAKFHIHTNDINSEFDLKNPLEQIFKFLINKYNLE